MLTHKGTQTIETERLLLRRATPEDALPMFRNWANEAEVTKFLTWPPHGTVQVTARVLSSWLESYEKEDFYQWMIALRQEPREPIGSISVVALDENTGSAEIGYCIGKPWWHQGIMSEALQGVLGFLFAQVGMNRLEAKHDANNPHSGGVMRKCGMKYEGTRRRGGRNNQGICDVACYAILKEEYRKGHFMADYTPADDTDLVQAIYSRQGEDARLSATKAGRVEFLTTVKYIEKYLSPGARILDLGAGTGAYSFCLARKGYRVCALELADANIRVFREKMQPGDSIDLVQGNAMDLSRYEDDSFDAVLLLGPLYHLHQDEDKLRCIREAKRVCRPGGKLFFAFIANDMVILTMQQAHPEYLLEGDYDKETFRLDDFPFVFHTPRRCRELLTRGGITICHELASDGLSELLGDMINTMDEATYQQYLRYHFYLCEKPESFGMTNHLLYVGEATR